MYLVYPAGYGGTGRDGGSFGAAAISVAEQWSSGAA